ncbi:Nuclear transport factor 2 [Emmonsiellopsis sp. PD_5]|nr:Nuclear transport factor 2 [Emmonsiellopsis sp. PD_5]
MLTFETNSVQGAPAITKQLVELPFQKVVHQCATVDAQPTEEGGVVVLVTGALMVDEEQKPMNYTQVFHLRRDASGYYVYNDIFKLIYPQ